jgi:hypothetical protein
MLVPLAQLYESIIDQTTGPIRTQLQLELCFKINRATSLGTPDVGRIWLYHLSGD